MTALLLKAFSPMVIKGNIEPPVRRFSIHRLALVVLFLILLLWGALLTLAMHQAVLPDKASGMVAVVFSPAMESDKMFTSVLRSDGLLVREIGFGNIWIVYSDNEGFVGRLKAEGAWSAFSPVVFDPLAVGGCFGMALR